MHTGVPKQLRTLQTTSRHRSIVGDKVGEVVGALVVGATVGARDGARVGAVVLGDSVGDDDGDQVGAALVGDDDGAEVGAAVDGDADGANVGVAVVGDEVGTEVGEAVDGDVDGGEDGAAVVGDDDGGDVGVSVVGDDDGELLEGLAVGGKVSPFTVGVLVGRCVGAWVGAGVGLPVGSPGAASAQHRTFTGLPLASVSVRPRHCSTSPSASLLNSARTRFWFRPRTTMRPPAPDPSWHRSADQTSRWSYPATSKDSSFEHVELVAGAQPATGGLARPFGLGQRQADVRIEARGGAVAAHFRVLVLESVILQ